MISQFTSRLNTKWIKSKLYSWAPSRKFILHAFIDGGLLLLQSELKLEKKCKRNCLYVLLSSLITCMIRYILWIFFFTPQEYNTASLKMALFKDFFPQYATIKYNCYSIVDFGLVVLAIHTYKRILRMFSKMWLYSPICIWKGFLVKKCLSFIFLFSCAWHIKYAITMRYGLLLLYALFWVTLTARPFTY